MSYKYYSTLKTTKNAVRFAYFPLDCIWFYLVILTFAMKLKNANYKSH